MLAQYDGNQSLHGAQTKDLTGFLNLSGLIFL